MKTPTSDEMAYLAGRIKGWVMSLQLDRSQLAVSRVIEDMNIASKEIAENFTNVEIKRYYPDET